MYLVLFSSSRCYTSRSSFAQRNLGAASINEYSISTRHATIQKRTMKRRKFYLFARSSCRYTCRCSRKTIVDDWLRNPWYGKVLRARLCSCCHRTTCCWQAICTTNILSPFLREKKNKTRNYSSKFFA